jgi:cadmium resistance protein CadD (predicted permease)
MIPRAWLGLLGFLPIAIGLSHFFKGPVEESSIQTMSEAWSRMGQKSRSPLFHILHPQTYQVAVVTIANGGDNIGIYVPLFANSDLTDFCVILITFLLMIAVWCGIAYYLTLHPLVASPLTRYGQRLVPFVLISLGIYILVESETFHLLSH